MANIVQIQKQEGRYNRYKILWCGKVVTALNIGGEKPDFFLLRPSFHPLYTPKGFPATEQGAHNYPHHKGVWIGHAKVGGVNCFHDYPGCGRIIIKEIEARADGEKAYLNALNHWVDKDGRPVLEEERRHIVTPGEKAHTIEISSTLVARFSDVELAAEKHAFIGIRVIDAIDADDGGLILNSHGEAGEEATMGEVADWVDCSGEMGGNRIGITLMVHPNSPPTPFFTRAYGTVLSDYFYDKGLTLRKGERFKQTFCVVAHDGDSRSYDIASAYQNFAQGSELAP